MQNSGAVTLSGVTVDNTGGAITVNSGASLTLTGSDTISGGALTDDAGGTVVIAATDSLTLEDGASVTVDFASGGNSTISTTGTGTVIIENDTLGASAGDAFGAGVSVSATGGTLTLDNVALDAGNSVTLGSGSVSIDGTAIDGYGTLSGDLPDITSVTADGGTLDITGLMLGTVAATIDTSTDALVVGATNQTVTFSSLANAGSVEVTAGTLDVMGAVTGGGRRRSTSEPPSTSARPMPRR